MSNCHTRLVRVAYFFVFVSCKLFFMTAIVVYLFVSVVDDEVPVISILWEYLMIPVASGKLEVDRKMQL